MTRRVATTAPLTPAQERLWFMYRLAPDSTAYSCAFVFESGSCDSS